MQFIDVDSDSGTVLLTAVMKGSMMIFALPCLLICWMPPVDSMTVSRGLKKLGDIPKISPILSVKDLYTITLVCKVKSAYK